MAEIDALGATGMIDRIALRDSRTVVTDPAGSTDTTLEHRAFGRSPKGVMTFFGKESLPRLEELSH